MTSLEDCFNSTNEEVLDLSNWDVSNVTNLSNCFSGCEKLNSLDLNQWNISKVTSLEDCFAYCNELSSAGAPNAGYLDS